MIITIGDKLQCIHNCKNECENAKSKMSYNTLYQICSNTYRYKDGDQFKLEQSEDGKVTMVEFENECGEWKAFSIQDILAAVLLDVKQTIKNES